MIKVRKTSVSALLFLLIAGMLLWWAFSGGGLASWIVGAPTVAVAAGVSLWLGRGELPRLDPLYAFYFLAVFIILSFSSGVDVARRAMGRRLWLAPGLMPYQLRLAPGVPRIFFILVISLLPGTLSADLEGERLTIHLLDRRMNHYAMLARLEEQVARLFRATLEEREKAPA